MYGYNKGDWIHTCILYTKEDWIHTCILKEIGSAHVYSTKGDWIVCISKTRFAPRVHIINGGTVYSQRSFAPSLHKL